MMLSSNQIVKLFTYPSIIQHDAMVSAFLLAINNTDYQNTPSKPYRVSRELQAPVEEEMICFDMDVDLEIPSAAKLADLVIPSAAKPADLVIPSAAKPAEKMTEIPRKEFKAPQQDTQRRGTLLLCPAPKKCVDTPRPSRR